MKDGWPTYVLDNAAGLPPEPVNDLANAAGTIMQPAHGVLEGRVQHRDLYRRPDGPEDIDGRARTVARREGVVVLWPRLQVSAHLGTWMDGCLLFLLLPLPFPFLSCRPPARKLTRYDAEMYSKALVRFLATMKASANSSKRALVSLVLGGGDMATHGGGVTTAGFTPGASHLEGRTA